MADIAIEQSKVSNGMLFSLPQEWSIIVSAEYHWNKEHTIGSYLRGSNMTVGLIFYCLLARKTSVPFDSNQGHKSWSM